MRSRSDLAVTSFSSVEAPHVLSRAASAHIGWNGGRNLKRNYDLRKLKFARKSTDESIELSLVKPTDESIGKE